MNEKIKTNDDILNEEIVRATLTEVNPETDDKLVEYIWSICDGNPWDAVPLYKILKTMGKL